MRVDECHMLLQLVCVFLCATLGKVIPEVFKKYSSVGATLNVLPFCTQFIPMDVINGAEEGSIIYHPSLLPRHRGASAINWSVVSMMVP